MSRTDSHKPRHALTDKEKQRWWETRCSCYMCHGSYHAKRKEKVGELLENEMKSEGETK